VNRIKKQGTGNWKSLKAISDLLSQLPDTDFIYKLPLFFAKGMTSFTI
jgi:hypothetical protein